MNQISTPLLGTQIQPSSRSKTMQLAVLFHGFESNGGTICGIRRSFEKYFPGAHIFAPNGPIRTGESTFRWFEPMNTNANKVYESLRSLSMTVNDTVDELQCSLGISDADTVFIGFSQGATVALHTGLMRRQRLAGIISYSGQIVKSTRLQEEIFSKPPICLIHGREDPVVPVDRLSQDLAFLMRENVAVKSHVCNGLKHGISRDGLVFGTKFMIDALKPKV